VWYKSVKAFQFDAEVFLSEVIDDNDVIIEQSTGLKDKNGKLIYENDLIKIDDDVAVINWSDYYARFMLESSEDIFDFERSYAEECEVIGNIHENADLIKVGGK
jgi:hypothetical protein